MYICPTCHKKFLNQEDISKHILSCWKELNPNVKSKDAPRSPDIVTREINDDILSFFNQEK